MGTHVLPDELSKAGHDGRDGPLDEGRCAVSVERVLLQEWVPSELVDEMHPRLPLRLHFFDMF